MFEQYYEKYVCVNLKYVFYLHVFLRLGQFWMSQKCEGVNQIQIWSVNIVHIYSILAGYCLWLFLVFKKFLSFSWFFLHEYE